jgi:hypothetical protein
MPAWRLIPVIHFTKMRPCARAQHELSCGVARVAGELGAPTRWRADPRLEAQAMNECWVEFLARARERRQHGRVEAVAAIASFPIDDR